MLYRYYWSMLIAGGSPQRGFVTLAVARARARPKPRLGVSITIVVFGDAVCDVRVCEQNHVHDMRPGAQRDCGTSLEGWR